MTPAELDEKYGRVWEFFPQLAIGVAAVRRQRSLTDEDYRRGMVPVLLAGDLVGLVPQLERQARL
ncbi:hypothetical protein [Thermoactinospora rubra]|uniref:hypothetical protein n=1 Tax=Thermoactinospora rubra TaxID=1088767 RepID=UPI000A111CDB|nr:hypothetical protein [Thermoactinospora rubra]